MVVVLPTNAGIWKNEDCYSAKICIEEFGGTPSKRVIQQYKYSTGEKTHIIDCDTGDKSIEFDWFEKSLKPDESIGQANRYSVLTGKQATAVLMARESIDQDRWELYEKAAKRANVIMYLRSVKPGDILPDYVEKYSSCR